MHKISLSERCRVGLYACDETNLRVRSLWTAENSLNAGHILVVRSSGRWSRGSSNYRKAIVIAAHWRQFRRFGPQGWSCRSHFRRTRPARQRASVVSRFAEVFRRKNLKSVWPELRPRQVVAWDRPPVEEGSPRWPSDRAARGGCDGNGACQREPESHWFLQLTRCGRD